MQLTKSKPLTDMLKNQPSRARKPKFRGSFSIFEYFQTAIFLAENFYDKYMHVDSVFYLAFL